MDIISEDLIPLVLIADAILEASQIKFDTTNLSVTPNNVKNPNNEE